MTPIRSMSDFARRHALVTFLLLTFGISWLGFFAGATLLFAFGPSLAGVMLVLLTYNREEQRSFWRRLIDFKRISPGWYLLIVLITPAVVAASIALDTLLGGAPPVANILSRIGEQPLEILSLALTSLLFGALSEELGWRGYALPVLLKRWGAMRSSLAVGVFWWAWHLPLFTVPGSSHNGWGWFTAMFWLFLLTVMSLSVLLTWTYVHNRASLLSAVLLHFCYNFSLGLVYPVSDRTQWFISTLFALVVAVVVLLRPVGRVLEREASAPADATPAVLGPGAA